MHKTLSLTLLLTLCSFNAWAYDAAMAAKIDLFTRTLDHAGLIKGSCKIEAEEVLKLLAAGEKLTLLDVRTPAETKVVALSHPSALHIPLDRLFKPENLDRLPKDGRIIVICHSGNRAASASALLKAIGFTNVSYINGGLIALVTKLMPKNLPVE